MSDDLDDMDGLEDEMDLDREIEELDEAEGVVLRRKSKGNVSNFPGRGSLGDPGFQRALRIWREFAHRRGLVVASPIRLLGAERTFYGDSDDVSFGPKDYILTNNGDLGVSLGDLWLSKKERELLTSIFPELDEHDEFDIKDMRAPLESNFVPPHDDERGRWDLFLTEKHKVGTVVRIGEGSKKHYLLYLWAGGWYRVTGQPCYDLPMFGLPELRARPDAPVMIHEGPKSWQGATIAASAALTSGRLANWMGTYAHVAWHGSDIGMEWTDWSPLRGRAVLVWPDMDDAGLANARNLSNRISQMGEVVTYINWGKGDIEAHETWDWGDADDRDEKCPSKTFTRTELRTRMEKVESPFGPDGTVLESWAKRSFYDPVRSEVYLMSRDYQPLPVMALRVQYGTFFRKIGLNPADIVSEIVNSPINPFNGTDYIPGVPYGRMARGGRLNLAKGSVREPIKPAPLPRELYEELVQRWLGRMIPDPRQRKHLLRRAAWALTRPEKVPQHMIILQGDSGIGKSVFMDILVAVAGTDRAASLMPDSILSKFNAQIAYKSVVCIHEIHSNDISRRQNASRLKELIANKVITIEEKNRPRVNHSNVIHWFAATNEKIPFTLEHGNDRFYFIKCAAPQNRKDARRKDSFFDEWVPRLTEEKMMDDLYAAAKWLALSLSPSHMTRMVGRAERQNIWKSLEAASVTPWEGELNYRLDELYEQEPDSEETNQPYAPFPAFRSSDIIGIVRKTFATIPPEIIRSKLNDMGFVVIRTPKGEPYRIREGKNRVTLWCREEHAPAFLAYLKNNPGTAPKIHFRTLSGY